MAIFLQCGALNIPNENIPEVKESFILSLRSKKLFD